MIKAVRIRLLGKEYTLRVDEANESAMVEMAAYLDAKLQAFRTDHPEQSDLTAAIITALAVTEELFMERSANLDPGETINSELDEMERMLTRALSTA